MKIGILANEGSWYYRDLDRAAKAHGIACERLDFCRLIASVSRKVAIRSCPVPESAPAKISSERPATIDRGDYEPSIHGCDVVIVRTMPPGSLEQVVYRMDVLARLQAAGIAVVNSPKSLESAVDKFLTTARLQEAGLPVPETVVCEHEDDAMEAFAQLGGDVVVKPIFGSEGRGIVRVSDPDLAHRTFRTLMRLDCVIYIQKFIDHGGCDVRVLVLDGQVVGGMRRRSANDFRTNVSRNGIAELHQATPREELLAVAAAKVTGAFIAGVDLLYDQDGEVYVIEVNAVPGWQAFSRVTGIDVAARLIERLQVPANP